MNFIIFKKLKNAMMIASAQAPEDVGIKNVKIEILKYIIIIDIHEKYNYKYI